MHKSPVGREWDFYCDYDLEQEGRGGSGLKFEVGSGT